MTNKGGNSGSPLTVESDGKVVGIVTAGSCADNIYNSGAYALSNVDVRRAMDNPLQICTPFRRGDVNDDGTVDVSDMNALSNWLYGSGPEPDCLESADANDDGFIDVADISRIGNWLYSGGPAPVAPGPLICGPERGGVFTSGTPYHGCNSYTSCP